MAESTRSAKPATPPVDKAKAAGEPAARQGGWLRWMLGWVLVPGLVLGSVFGGGVFLGANHPDIWFVRAVMWTVARF